MNRVYLDPNTKYSDQYAMLAKLPDIVDEINEVADKAEQVPDPAVADIGKVLGIVSDGASGAEYGAVAPASGLPAIESGDAGKVLTVNESHTAAEWAAPSGGGMTVYDVYYSLEVPQDATYLRSQLPALTEPLYYHVSQYQLQPYKDASLTQEYPLSEFTALIDAMTQGTALIHLHEMSTAEHTVYMATNNSVDTDMHNPPIENDYFNYSIGEPLNNGDQIGYTAQVKDGGGN